jgi:menaquinone reductase, multiheme cytochrome c subunit
LRTAALSRPALALGVLAAALGAGVLLSSRPTDGVVQPIAFDHALHTQQDLACLDCHKTAETGPYAGTPKLATCLLCHAEAQGEHPDEARIREHAERGEEIAWVQVNRMAGHVYFSHAMHVKVGAMDCAECHGDMSSATTPPARSQIEHLSMSRCIECHAERGASNDCLTCHK